MTSAEAIRVTRLTKVHGRPPNHVVALNEVDLVFHRGTFTAIMGPSGSGKTTLLQCAAGLDRPTGGEVRLGDTRIDELPERELTRLRRSRIGFVFQSFNLLTSLTAEQNVSLPLRLAGRRVDAEVVRRLLADVGLGDRWRHRPGQMSGGQQQRVALARALVTDPKILFADEPTGALDTLAGEVVLRHMVEAARSRRMSVVIVTHDARVAAYADREVRLRDGTVESDDRFPQEGMNALTSVEGQGNLR